VSGEHTAACGRRFTGIEVKDLDFGLFIDVF